MQVPHQLREYYLVVSQLRSYALQVDSIAEGVDTVGVEWHVQIKGRDGSDFLLL